MKKQIRRGVFETNSSSVHSISIIKDDFKGELPKYFVIECDGEFGWEVNTYENPRNKAAYLYQAIKCYPRYSYIKQAKVTVEEEKIILQNLLDTFISNLESFGIKVECEYRYTKIEHHYYNYNGKEESYDYVEFVNNKGDKCKGGYLDHGGEAKELVDFVLSTPENTIKFILDNRCYIETGNDNEYCYGDSRERNYGDSIIFEKGN